MIEMEWFDLELYRLICELKEERWPNCLDRGLEQYDLSMHGGWWIKAN